MQINPTFAFVSGATASDVAQFENAVNTVIAYFDSIFTNVNVTLNVAFAYGESYLSNTPSSVILQPITPNGPLGISETALQSFSYSTVLSQLQGNANELQASAYATLPTAQGNPFAADTLLLTAAQAKALGFTPTNSIAGYDGVIGIISNEELQAGGFSADWTKSAPTSANQYYMIG